MLLNTEAIVLKYIKFRETSIIITIYTKEFGLKQCILNGVRTSKSKLKIALFQHLTLLDLILYDNKNHQKIHRIADAHCFYPFKNIPFDFKKTSVALFMTEVLNKCLKEEEKNQSLFEFIKDQIILLDQVEQDTENFLIQFMIHFSRYLGFQISSGSALVDELDQYGILPADNKSMIEHTLNNIINTDHPSFNTINNAMRGILINTLIDFYRLHIEGFGQIRSIGVLRTVLK